MVVLHAEDVDWNINNIDEEIENQSRPPCGGRGLK